MGVDKHGAAHAIIADDGANARKCNIETHRFRKLWREQAELNLARAAWLCREGQRQDGSMGRMGFEIKIGSA